MKMREGFTFATTAAEQAAGQHLLAKHLGAFARRCPPASPTDVRNTNIEPGAGAGGGAQDKT